MKAARFLMFALAILASQHAIAQTGPCGKYFDEVRRENAQRQLPPCAAAQAADPPTPGEQAIISRLDETNNLLRQILSGQQNMSGQASGDADRIVRVLQSPPINAGQSGR